MIIKAVSFDFDGVFVRDSDAVYKKEAWEKTLAPYGAGCEVYLREGNNLYGSGKQGGRVEILRYILLRLGESEKVASALAVRMAQVFDDYVQAKILEVGLVDGALDALVALKRRGLLLYLNSGTATRALIVSARNLGIEGFFNGIFGSMRSKVDNLGFVVRDEVIEPAEIMVVGDGDSDVEAARIAGCPFVGVQNHWNQWSDGQQEFPVVSDLGQLVKMVGEE